MGAAYYYLSRDAAHKAFTDRSDHLRPDIEQLQRRQGDGPLLSLDRLISELRTCVGSTADVPAHRFEGQIGSVLHQHLRGQPATGDPRFWLWLSLGPAADIVVERANRYGTAYSERLVGLGPLKEGFLYRCFLRADLGFDEAAPVPEEAYRHALVGDQDFWVSHMIRISFAARKDILHSIVRFQYPGLRDEPRLATGTHPLGMRLLAKRIRRYSSTTSLVFIDAEEWERTLRELASRKELETVRVVKDDGTVDYSRLRMLDGLVEAHKVHPVRVVPSKEKPREYHIRASCITAEGEPYSP